MPKHSLNPFEKLYNWYEICVGDQSGKSVIDDAELALETLRTTGDTVPLLQAGKDIAALSPAFPYLNKALLWIISNHYMPPRSTSEEHSVFALESLNIIAKHRPSTFKTECDLANAYTLCLHTLPDDTVQIEVIQSSLAYQKDMFGQRRIANERFCSFLEEKIASLKAKDSPKRFVNAQEATIEPMDSKLAESLQKAVNFQHSPAMHEIFLTQAIDLSRHTTPKERCLDVLIKIDQRFFQNLINEEVAVLDIRRHFREAFKDCVESLPHFWQKVDAYSYLRKKSRWNALFAQEALDRIHRGPKVPTRFRVRRFLKEQAQS